MANRIRVLYVDDEPRLLEIARIFLERKGEFAVDVLPSAQTALEAPDFQSYDAVVADYLMPGMDGIAFLKAVRKRFGDMPFILFTGKGREEVVIEAINNGADFYLQKGGDPTAQFAELAHQIRQAVKRKHAEVTLAEQEQRYHDLLNANDLIQSVSPDGHFLFVNKKWLDTLGYREEDLPEMTVFDIIHEESLEHCKETFRRVISGENVGIIDAVFKTLCGERVYVEGMANCKLLNDTCQYTRGLFKDVSDRKRAELELLKKNEELNTVNKELAVREEEIRESSEAFRAVVEQSNEAIIIIDFSGRLLFANPRAAEIIDSREDLDVSGAINVLDFLDPDARQEAIGALGEVEQGHDRFLVTYRITTLTGRERWLECIGKKIAFRDSAAMLLSFWDITDRRKAEEEMRDSENKFATVFKGNPVSLTLVSASDGLFADVNDAFLRHTGYSRAEVIGRKSTDLGIFPDPAEYALLESALRERRHVENLDIHCRIKTGEIRSCRFSSSIIQTGGRSYVLSSVEDITKQKAAESAVQALVTGMAGTTGKESLYRMSESLARWLSADCIMIGEILPDRENVAVISMILDGRKVDDHSYTLQGTPCENAAEKGFCVFADDVAGQFPKCRDLHALGIRGYAGTPLHNSLGQTVGILCVMTRRPLILPPSAREIIDIAAAKAAAEIGRLKAIRTLSESEEKFRTLVEYSLDGTLILDLQGKILFANPAAGKLIKADSLEEIVGRKNVLEFIAPESKDDVLHDFLEVAGGIDGYLARYKVVTIDGKDRWVESIGKSITFGDSPAILISLRDITEGKKSEADLRESEEKFRKIFSSSAIGTTLALPDFRFLLVNPAWESMIGYSGEEMQNITFRDITHPDDLAMDVRGIGDLEAGTIPVYRTEKRYIRKDGSILWGSVNVTAIRNPAGVVLYYLAQIEDITPRKRAEEALVDEITKRKILINQSGDGIVTLDDQGGVYEANLRFTEMLGYTPAEIQRLHVWDWDTQFSREQVFEMIRTIPPEGAHFETRHRRKDGTVLDVELSNNAAMFSAKKLIFCVVRDITGRKRMEEALRKSEEMLALVMNSVPTFLAYLDTDLRFVYINKPHAAWYGRTEGELIGTSLRDLLSGDVFTRASPYFREVLDGKENLFENLTRDQYGQQHTLAVHLVPAVRDGIVVGFFAALNDITDHRQAEEALRQANKKLNLLSGITRHDIRNTITVILGLSALAAEEITDPSISAYIRGIESATKAILSQIEFTKIYQDLGMSEPQWLNVTTVLPRDQIPAAITLTSSVDGLEVYADPMLEKVFSNLLDNSVRHGEKVTDIRILSIPTDNGLKIVWEDNGVGIPAEEKKRIFERGYGKNTGFGLFISREILDITGITIAETGEPGCGARFEIDVPSGKYRPVP